MNQGGSAMWAGAFNAFQPMAFQPMPGPVEAGVVAAPSVSPVQAPSMASMGADRPAQPDANQQRQAFARAAEAISDVEKEYYTSLWQAAGVPGPILGGKAAFDFLSKSQLPREMLKRIWDIADWQKRGLAWEEFVVTLKLISAAQKKQLVSLDRVLASSGPTSRDLPIFDGIAAPAHIGDQAQAAPQKRDVFAEFEALAVPQASPEVETQDLLGGSPSGPGEAAAAATVAEPQSNQKWDAFGDEPALVQEQEANQKWDAFDSAPAAATVAEPQSNQKWDAFGDEPALVQEPEKSQKWDAFDSAHASETEKQQKWDAFGEDMAPAAATVAEPQSNHKWDAFGDEPALVQEPEKSQKWDAFDSVHASETEKQQKWDAFSEDIAPATATVAEPQSNQKWDAFGDEPALVQEQEANQKWDAFDSVRASETEKQQKWDAFSEDIAPAAATVAEPQSNQKWDAFDDEPVPHLALVQEQKANQKWDALDSANRSAPAAATVAEPQSKQKWDAFGDEPEEPQSPEQNEWDAFGDSAEDWGAFVEAPSQAPPSQARPDCFSFRCDVLTAQAGTSALADVACSEVRDVSGFLTRRNLRRCLGLFILVIVFTRIAHLHQTAYCAAFQTWRAQYAFPDLEEDTCEDPDGTSSDGYLEALMLPPRKRMDFLIFVIMSGSLIYLVEWQDTSVKVPKSSATALELEEREESRAVRKLQAMYFDRFCGMRPGASRLELELPELEGSTGDEASTPQVSEAQPKRLLLLHASPFCWLTRGPCGECMRVPLRRLRISQELAAVEKALSGKLRVDVDVASIHNLRKAKTKAKTEDLWLHLSAHTENGNALVLEDGCGGTEALSLEALVRLLRSGGEPQRGSFVFLSNCQSQSLAAAFYAAGVRHIVYTKRPVTDAMASRFASGLYLHLACGFSLKEAFQIARAEVDPIQEGDSGFRLLAAEDVRLRECTSACKWKAALRSPAFPLPSQVEDFVGREEILYDILQLLSQRRVVVLHCQRSLGRTALLLEIAHYMSVPGRRFAQRCIFGQAQEVKDGLLILDDADAALTKHQDLLRKNLECPDFFLLVGCRYPHWDLFQDQVKPVHVELPPLSALASATLFAQRCHRPLTLQDVLPGGAASPSPATRALSRERARQLLRPLVSVFQGNPALIRQARSRSEPLGGQSRSSWTQLIWECFFC
ncbi:unnamed protein product [Effrenium voratum]|nr:unnamed protein product [Effrenium voratum]